MGPIVVVLNGPNLNLLGKREPEIYGRETLADVEADCRRVGASSAFDRFHQSNREYEIIDLIHAARERAAGIVINPAAFTHTSVAILDALNAFSGPIIEVHISNVHKREPFRHHSYVRSVASGVIVGSRRPRAMRSPCSGSRADRREDRDVSPERPPSREEPAKAGRSRRTIIEVEPPGAGCGATLTAFLSRRAFGAPQDTEAGVASRLISLSG